MNNFKSDFWRTLSSTGRFSCQNSIISGVGVNNESVVNESVATDPWYDSGGGPSKGELSDNKKVL